MIPSFHEWNRFALSAVGVKEDCEEGFRFSLLLFPLTDLDALSLFFQEFSSRIPPTFFFFFGVIFFFLFFIVSILFVTSQYPFFFFFPILQFFVFVCSLDVKSPSHNYFHPSAKRTAELPLASIHLSTFASSSFTSIQPLFNAFLSVFARSTSTSLNITGLERLLLEALAVLLSLIWWSLPLTWQALHPLGRRNSGPPF